MQEKRLEQESANRHDALTGLPNDDDFSEKGRCLVEKASAEKTAFALYIIHIANLKDIVISHGLPVAETILKTVTGHLYGVFQPDKVFARLESDCLGLLQQNVSHRGHVLYVARRILESLEDPVCVLGQKFGIRTNIGIALYPDHGTEWEDIYARARACLEKTPDPAGSAYKIYE